MSQQADPDKEQGNPQEEVAQGTAPPLWSMTTLQPQESIGHVHVQSEGFAALSQPVPPPGMF
ncbi:MAG: hypothetical protein MHM6MM_007002, partial [Cercozoa sp. M6MM]